MPAIITKNAINDKSDEGFSSACHTLPAGGQELLVEQALCLQLDKCDKVWKIV